MYCYVKAESLCMYNNKCGKELFLFIDTNFWKHRDGSAKACFLWGELEGGKLTKSEAGVLNTYF